MSPPELVELTPCLYSSKMHIASEELENAGNLQFAESELAGNRLLDEESLAKLVPTDKGFHGAKTTKEILDFAILEDLLRRAELQRGKHLECVRIRHPVALETFRLLAVEHGEDYSAGPQKIRQAGYDLFPEGWLEIIQEIP